jgi:hypothetical protein
MNKKVIEDFVNSEVVMVKPTVFQWGTLLFEVMTYKQMLKDKTLKASHFLKWDFKGREYAIRELSQKVYKKRYEK